MNQNVVHVAVGVIFNAQGQILIALRSEHVHQGGLWEFPGGKVEPGEDVQKALSRELQEELNIHPTSSRPLIKIHHDYRSKDKGDKSVLLDVWCVTGFTGKLGVATGHEGQTIKWVEPLDLACYQFPAANIPIIKAIQLPSTVLITGDVSSQEDYLNRLQVALASGVKLVQFRANYLTTKDYIAWAKLSLDLCRRFAARLMLNADPQLLQKLEADGIHLNVERLAAFKHRPVAEDKMCSAACHNREQLSLAEKLHVDFAFLSPVNGTSSHPDATPITWSGFQQLVAQVNIPVYALGGVSNEDLAQAYRAGAQGVAGIGAYWEPSAL